MSLTLYLYTSYTDFIRLYRGLHHSARGGIGPSNAAVANFMSGHLTREGGRRGGGFFKSAGAGGGEATAEASRAPAPPVEYTMRLHAPLVVENLLPHAGDFELVDQVQRKLKLYVCFCGKLFTFL